MCNRAENAGLLSFNCIDLSYFFYFLNTPDTNEETLRAKINFFFRFLKLIRLNIVQLSLDSRPLNVLERSAPLSILSCLPFKSLFHLEAFSDQSRLAKVPLFCTPQIPHRHPKVNEVS